MVKKILSVLVFFSSLTASAVSSQVNVYSYSSGNVSTSAYTVLVASTPVSAGSLEICDTSTHLLKIATGKTGSELDVATVAVSGCVVIPIYIPIGTQLNIKAIDASATTGFNTIAYL